MFVRLLNIAQRQRPELFNRFLSGIDPSGRFFYFWTASILIVFVYNLVVCPMFIFEEFSEYHLHWLAFNQVADIFNFCDLFVQARRGRRVFRSIFVVIVPG